MRPKSPLRTAISLALIIALAGCNREVTAAGGAVPVSSAHNQPSATTTSVPSTPTSAPVAAAKWHACPEVAKAALGNEVPTNVAYDCAAVPVPADWHHPETGKTYSIAMLRVRSKTQKNRIGSLFINPGGPGGSGVKTALYLSVPPNKGGLPTQITDRFDFIGFDPRGVNLSSPLQCISDRDLDASYSAVADPVSSADFNSVVALDRRINNACAKKYGSALSTYSTEQAARDIDALRAAVGDPKLSYLGYSYGTLLGATYAQQFPQNVRAMVLDGALDPTESLVTSSEGQAKGFEHAFDNFGAWCKNTPKTCPIAPEARKTVSALLANADQKKVKGSDGRIATSGIVGYAIVAALYNQAGWPLLAQAMASLQKGDAKLAFQLADGYAERAADGTHSNQSDINLAVNCSDAKSVPSLAEIRRLQADWRRKYPLFGGFTAAGLLSCALWPEKPDPYPTGPAVGAPPIVVVGTTGDPATPYENTAKLASMLGVGHVLTWQGEGHTAYPQTPCITSAVDDYLLTLAVPADGKACPLK